MSRDYLLLKRKKQKRKDGREWVVVKYSYIYAIVIFAVALLCLIDVEVGLFMMPVFSLVGVLFLIAAINCRVTMNTEQVTVRNFFRISKTYLFSEIESWRENTHYVYLYPVNGRRICLKKDDEVDGGLGDLSLQLKKRNIKEREGASDSKLYWGNCSRPVQLTFFLFLMSLVLLLLTMCVCSGMRALLEREENLERKSFVVTDVLVDETYVHLYEDAEIFFDFDQTDLPTYDWNTLKGTRVTVLVDDVASVWGLYDRYGNELFDFDDSYNANKKGAIIMTVICGLLALIPLALIIVNLVAYKFPDRYPELYIKVELMNYWSRH